MNLYVNGNKSKENELIMSLVKNIEEVFDNIRTKLTNNREETMSHTGNAKIVDEESIVSLMEGIEELLHDVKAKVKNRLDSAITTTKDTGQKVDQYARENPWNFAAMALAAGFLVGFFSRKE